MLEQIVQAYKTVIEDILDDDTWLPESKKQVLSLLRTRLMECETIWNIPDELWHEQFDEVELPEPDEPDGDDDPDQQIICDMCNGAGEDRYEQTCRWCHGRGIES